MQQHIDLWKQTAEAFQQRFAAIADDQWQSDTTCDGWNVQALVDHTVEVQAGYAGSMVGAEIGEGAGWPEVHAAIAAALDANPAALEGTMPMPAMGGDVPKAMMFGIATSDLLVHTWDLARSIGADETLPAGPVTACHEGLKRFPPDMMRAEGRFGPAVECAPDADAQTQMLSFAGRAV